MFRRRSFFPRVFLALLILGALAATSMMAYRAGTVHGYAQGMTTTIDEEDAELLPLAPPHPFLAPRMARHTPHLHFPFMRPFFCGGILILIGLALLFRPHFWHHPPMPWHKHPHKFGHPHPWSECKEPLSEEDTKTAEKTDAASAR